MIKVEKPKLRIQSYPIQILTPQVSGSRIKSSRTTVERKKTPAVDRSANCYENMGSIIMKFMG